MGNVNEHFLAVGSATEAEPLIGFRPRMPGYTAGRELDALQVFVRDHRMRDVPVDESTGSTRSKYESRRFDPDRRGGVMDPGGDTWWFATQSGG